MPIYKNLGSVWCVVMKLAIAGILKEPVAPYTNVIPKRRNPVAKEPIRKYLKAASVENKFSLLLPANTYNEIDNISIPKNRTAMLLNATIMSAPAITKNTNADLSVRCASPLKKSPDIQYQKMEITRIRHVKEIE